MTKKTKTILGVVVVGAIAFYLYKRKKSGKSLLPFGNFSGDDNFFNVNGTRRTSMPRGTTTGCSQDDPSCNICGDSCVNGVCYVAIYNQSGTISTYQQHRCSGLSGNQISRGRR
jgi:hypothetical protein